MTCQHAWTEGDRFVYIETVWRKRTCSHCGVQQVRRGSPDFPWHDGGGGVWGNPRELFAKRRFNLDQVREAREEDERWERHQAELFERGLTNGSDMLQEAQS